MNFVEQFDKFFEAGDQPATSQPTEQEPEGYTPKLPANWTGAEETEFQDWYVGWAKEAGIDTNPDDPRHFYDYREAYRAGAFPTISEEDGRLHWPSQFKLDEHPNRFVGGVDTRTGIPVGGPTETIAESTPQMGEGAGTADMGFLLGREGEVPFSAGRTASQFGRMALRSIPQSVQAWNDLLYLSVKPESRTRGEITQEQLAQGGAVPGEPDIVGGYLGLQAPTAVDDPKIRAYILSKQPEIREDIELIYKYFPEILPGNPSILEAVLTAPAGFAIPMVASGLSGGAGFFLTFLTSYGSAMEEYTKQGVSEDRARDAAMFQAITTTPIEFAGNLIQVGNIKKLMGFGAGKRVTPKAIEVAEMVAQSAAGEGLEEFLQQYFQIAANYYAANPDMSSREIADYIFKNFGKHTVEALKAGALGAASGALLTGTFGASRLALDEFKISRENDKLYSKFEDLLKLEPGTVKKAVEAKPGQTFAQVLDSVLMPPAMGEEEQILKIMGAIPEKPVEMEEEEEAPAPRPVVEEEIPRIDFVNEAEAKEAGATATEEEITDWQGRVEKLAEQGKFLSEIGNYKASKKAIDEVRLYNAAIKAYNEPEVKKPAPEKFVEAEPGGEVEAQIGEPTLPEKLKMLHDMNGMIVEQQVENNKLFSFDNEKDVAWLKSLGYSDFDINYARKNAYRPKLRGRGQGDLRNPVIEVPGAKDVVYTGTTGKVVEPPAVGKTYAEAAQVSASKQNLLVQPKPKPGRVLLAQISTGATAMGAEPGAADSYFNKLYTAREGYMRPEDFWEVPQWIPTAAKSLKDSDALVVRDPAAAAEQIKSGGYDAVMFSAMEVNKHVIKDIAQRVGAGTRVIVGGYVDKAYFKDTPNVEFHDSLESAVSSLGERYVPGLDAKHFRDTPTVPRLCLSEGCLHKCAFCTVPKGVTPRSKESIDEQLDNLKGLKFKLVYLDDKTLGQAETHKLLPEIRDRILKFNPEFQGFVVQTTAPQLLKLETEWLKSSGIKFVELGVESFNDEILAKIHKPAREKTINAAVEKLRETQIAFIPNVMVGLSGKGWSETKETYARTIQFLKDNADIISHVNVYNLALYEGTELAKELEKREDIDIDENRVERSYLKNPKLHESFYKAVLRFGEQQLSKKPFERTNVQEVELAMKELTPEEQEKYKLFKEKRKPKIEKWVQPKGEEVIDEETQEKVKAVELTPEAMAALDKANVKYGPGPFHVNSNFLVSVTERGGLIYGLAREGDKKTVRTVKTLEGPVKVTEYHRTIAGKEFKVLNVPILPKGKAERSTLIDKLVKQFKSETDWYKVWNEFMHKLTSPKYTPEQVDKMLKVQAVLSAGSSPAAAQTAFKKAWEVLEEFGSVVGGEGKGFTKNMAKKINMIWNGEEKDVDTLEKMQKFYGKKIGAMVFAALHPGIKQGAVVVDRHMTRLWGYNAMWGGSFRVNNETQQLLEQDISEAAERLDLPTAAVQAALWYAAGAGHWGSATHFEEAIRLHPAKSLSAEMMTLLTEEPQAIVSFHDVLHYTLRGAQPARKWTKEEAAKVKMLMERRDAFSGMGLPPLHPSEERELLDLIALRDGIKPNSWSNNDVKKRIEAATASNRFVPLTYWYSSGVRREAWFWGKEPHLTRIYDFQIYDAAEDKLGYKDLAWKRVHNDPDVKAGKRDPEQVFMNALASLIKETEDFKGFSIDMNGNTWMLTFDEAVVEEHPVTVTVGLSDVVNSAVKLPNNLPDLATISSNLVSHLEDHLVKGLKDYPVTVVSAKPTLARFGDTTAGQMEYGISAELKGPITAIRAALSHLVGLQKHQEQVLIFTHGADGTMLHFEFDESEIDNIDSSIKKYGIHDFNLKRDKAKWVFETFIHNDEADNQEKIDRILNMYENVGKEGTLTNTKVGAEVLTRNPNQDGYTYHTDYKYHILNYYGKAKGEKVHEQARNSGEEWAANSQLLFATEAAKAGFSGNTDGEKRSVRDMFRDPEDEGVEAQIGPTERANIVIDTDYGRRIEVNLLINPSFERIRGLMNRSVHGSVRVIVGPDGTLYAWPAEQAIHWDVAKYFKVQLGGNTLTTEINEYNAREQVYRIKEAIKYAGGDVEAMLMGPGAIGAPATKLQKAIELGLKGTNVNEVWRQTGWRMGSEGMWRFEIDDNGSSLADAFVEFGVRKMHAPVAVGDRTFTLAEVFKHPSIYKHYPQLRDVKVVVVRDMYGGYYDPETKTIGIGTLQFTVEELKSFAPFFSMMHEVQHAVQHIEGFPMGSSPQLEYKRLAAVSPDFRKLSHEKRWDLAFAAYNRIAGEIEANIPKWRSSLTAEEKAFYEPYLPSIQDYGPIKIWLIRHPGTSFSINPTVAPHTKLIDYYNGVRSQGNVAKLIIQALKASGLDSYPDLVKRIEMVLTPFINAAELKLSKATIEGHAQRWGLTEEQVRSQLAKKGDIVLGYTRATDLTHILVGIALNSNPTNEKKLHTIFHEFWHVIEKTILPPEVLSKLKKLVEQQERAKGNKPKIGVEDPYLEARANLAADYFLGRQGVQPSWLDDIMSKVVMFFKYLRAQLLGIDFTHPDQIFEWQARGYFKPGYQQRLELRTKEKERARRIRASQQTVSDLDEMDNGPASVKSAADREDVYFDNEFVAKKRIKDLTDTWMQNDAVEANIEMSGWTPEKGRADIGGEDVMIPKAIELPELLEIYKMLMQGQIPGVREKLFGNEAIRGVFIPGKGLVRLRAANFKDPALATRVLAHEIGHIVDWLPEYIIKGNILGKIAGLKHAMMQTLPFKPGAPGELQEADLKRLREEAVKLLGVTQELRTKWIDTTLTEEVGIKPEDVLAIWNNLEANIKETNPALYKYIAGLSSDSKKLIIKQALKGLLAPELEQFKKTIKTGPTLRKQVTEVVYKQPTQEEIEKKFADLVADEIRKRKLWVEEEVRDELLTLSMRWRPFDMKQASQSYVNYRHSSEELYADALSALICDPQFLRAQAPKFYEAFFNYIDVKPEFKRAYLEIQREIAAGEVDKERTRRFFEMFDRGNDAYGKLYEDRTPGWKDSAKQALLDRFHFIIKDVRKVGGQNISVEDNPEYKLEEMVYTGSEQEGFVTDVYHNVIKVLEKANLKWDREFGLVVMLRRLAFDVKGQAMPGGFDQQKALEKIAAMRDHELTPAQWEALKTAVKNFRELHEKYFIDKAEAAEVYDNEMITKFRDNDTYATFDVLPYLEERYGRATAMRVFHKVGALQDIANPATSTVMKDMAFMKAVNKNIAVRAVIKFYQDYANILGIDVQPCTIGNGGKKWNGRYMEIKEPKDSKLGLLVYLHKGKAYGFYLPKSIADSVNENETQHLVTARVFRFLATPFRKLFTELNYGFWMFNAFFRDAQRLVMTLPGWRVDKFAKHWLAGLKPAFKSVFGISDEVIKEMQQNHMLISIGDYRGLNEEDEQMERLLKLYQMKPPKEFHGKITKPFGHLFNYLTHRARLTEYYFSGVGRALERTTKVAAYTYLTEKFPDMPLEVIGHIVRTRGGSPDFLRAGKEQQLYNNILMFSNAIKEGYRGDWEAFKNNPGEFAAKKIVFTVIPKLLMYAGLIGLLGPAIKDIFDGVSEYDLTNYFIVPVGRTKSGKLVYWRVPTDETSRFFGGVLFKVLRSPELGLAKSVEGLHDYLAGQAPTVSPGVSILIDVIEYASGQNPYDHFYGRHAIGDLEFQAQDNRARIQFMKHILNKAGASIVYKFKNDKVDKIAEEMESILGFPIDSKVADFMIKAPDYPVLTNLLGRFLKVSDYGVREDALKVKEEIKRDNARILLDAREGVYAIVDGETPTNEQVMAIMQKPDTFKNQLMMQMARKYGMVYYEEWLRAGTKQEKAAIIKLMMEKNALNKQESTPLTAAPPKERPREVSPPLPELPPLNFKETVEKGIK